MSTDPHQWLEDVDGDDALAWVREQNASTVGRFTDDSRFEPLRQRLLKALDSDERIPYVMQRGAYVTNFWRDADHPRGLWRRTTYDDYAAGEPTWETLLDLDALAESEGENWVLGGVEYLRPSYDRALVLLSRGGADAVVVREFDLTTAEFVSDGFVLPEAKIRVAWINRDTLFVGTDFGDGSLTDSGYPRLVKRWRRGTPLAEAELVLEGDPGDVAAAAWHEPGPDGGRSIAYRRTTFFTEEAYAITAEGLKHLDKPASATLSFHHTWGLLELRDDWTTGGRTFQRGSLLAQPYAAWLEGGQDWEVLFAPTESTSLAGFASTRSHVVINTLDHVKSRVLALSPGPDGWTRRPLFDGERDGFDEIQVGAVDPWASDALWVYRSGFTTPSTFARIEAPGAEERELRRLPALFDATDLEVSQHFATSEDGTRVPYFQVGRRDRLDSGDAPTLMRGYGGFEIPLLAGYEAVTGISWLEDGGVYVVANIRGGGEYGPDWHQAALKEKRPRAYEDFEAIARDLVARGVTRPGRLGARGGSNGGLLMGNMYVRSPELWGAIVCQVPLLDMKRFTKLLAGASWAGEYGDPDDPEQWAHLQTISPYHLLADDGRAYPPLLLTTSTRDDRVHPGHARKFKAALATLERPGVWYYENVEGGHGGAANNEQSAYLGALAYTFLWQMLTRDDG